MTFVAYLVHTDDSHLIPESGLGYFGVGATEDEAIAKVRAAHLRAYEEESARAKAAGYEVEPPLSFEDEGYILHVQPVE